MTKSNTGLKWALIFLTVVILSATAIFFQNRAPGAKTALVIQDGEIIRKIPLNVNDEPTEFEVISPSGGKNTVRVENGKIGIIHADCPDKLCVKTGFTDSPSLPVVCLPNKLSLTVTGGEAGVDAVTGGR